MDRGASSLEFRSYSFGSSSNSSEVQRLMLQWARLLTTAGLGVSLGLLAGCAPSTGTIDPSSSAPSSAAAHEVVVDGSSTVLPISMAAQEGFESVNSAARVIVDSHGTGGGFGRYLEGEVDIVDASRLAKREEEADAKAKGFDWTRFLVAHDGITIVVNPKNDFVTSLSVEQLHSLFAVDSKVKTWKDLDPSWPDRVINLYTPDDDSGTYEFFAEAIVGGKAHRKEGVQPSSDDNMLVTGVAADLDGLGYFGYAYYAENKDRVKVVPLQASPESEPVIPSTESIYAKTYTPLSRPLFIYVKNKSLGLSEVRGFVTYYLENVSKLAEQAGYVAPTPEELKSNDAALTQAIGAGTGAESE